MATYVPGTLETDLKKVIMSLQQIGPSLDTANTNIATNTTNIATNTSHIAAWPGTTVGQLPFPASQVASADPNTLDDYEEGTWTPVLTFATPGNLSVSYSSITQGYYTKVGRLIAINFAIVTTAYTFTTASGQMTITGLPFTSVNDSNFRAFSTVYFQGINKASYTVVTCAVVGNSSQILVYANGMGQTASAVNAADTTSGTQIQLGGTFSYVV